MFLKRFVFRSLLFITPFIFISRVMLAQERITAGPMLGHVNADSLVVWLQTKNASSIHFSYWEIKDSSHIQTTKKVISAQENAFIVKSTFKGLIPDRTYKYNVFVNDTNLTFPYPLVFTVKGNSDSVFRIALGSCLGISSETSDFDILKQIASLRPEVMVWLGDNVYLNNKEWETKEKMIQAYNRHRIIPQLQPLLASTNHYALWDDHDYGPNDAARNHPTKKLSREIFNMYWANPTAGINDEGIFTTFTWGDVQFFLTDDRYWRAPNLRLIGKKPLLGAKQIEWLIDSLKASKANFKIIALGNQVLNPVLYKENYSTYGTERNRLLRRLKKNNITGVLFVTGDRHHSELTKREMGTKYPLYDLTVSPLTSAVHNKGNEHNHLRVENSLVMEKSFATLDFSGPPDNRQMEIKVYNNKGLLLWQKPILASQLR